MSDDSYRDEFESEAQTSGPHVREHSGPFISSQLTNKQLQEIREMYGVPNELEPLYGESVRDANDGEVVFYPYLFRLGVRIPLHPFCCRFLTFFVICPTQLTPNGWVVLLGIVVLSHLSGLPLDMRTLRSFFSLKYKSGSGY